jgi:hypothetical protein
MWNQIVPSDSPFYRQSARRALNLFLHSPFSILYSQMSDPAPNAELLRSLGQLARGLSALFWGLPAALIICAETARASLLKPLGILPALIATGLMLYGLWQMSRFQKQERPWRHALDRAQLPGLINFGLCPFLYWQNKMPQEAYFNTAVFALLLSAVFFLFNLNVVLKQLGAMRAQPMAARRAAAVRLGLCRPASRPAPAGQPRFAVCLDQPVQLLGADLLCPAAARHDHGADLEDQGGHSRRRLRFAAVIIFDHQATKKNQLTLQFGFFVTLLFYFLASLIFPDHFT